MTHPPTPRRPLALLAGSLALLLAACGGGGSTPPPIVIVGYNHLFTGTYHLASLGGTMGPPEEVVAWWGAGVSAGVDHVAVESAMNDGGVVSPAAVLGDIPYAVGMDRRLLFHLGFPSVDFASGGITADGSVAALATSFPGADPRVFLMSRQEGAHSLASLNGVYHFAGYVAAVPLLSNGSMWGTFTFDGTGGATALVSLNNEGVLVGPAPVPGITYAVAPEGRVTITFPSGFALEGGIHPSLDLVVSAGSSSAAQPPALFAFVRQGAGLDAAALDGPHFIVGLYHESATNVYHSFTGTLIANGAGTGTLFAIDNEEGMISLMPPEGLAYAVAPNGALTVTAGGGNVLEGGVVAGGRFGVLGGAANAGANPVFAFFFE